MLADLITVVIVLVILGVVLYLIEHFVPMEPWIRIVIRVVLILGVVIWLLGFFGIWTLSRLR